MSRFTEQVSKKKTTFTRDRVKTIKIFQSQFCCVCTVSKFKNIFAQLKTKSIKTLISKKEARYRNTLRRWLITLRTVTSTRVKREYATRKSSVNTTDLPVSKGDREENARDGDARPKRMQEEEQQFVSSREKKRRDREQ